ncbi:MAG: hypothetical protein KC777_05055 [Cyanobacteria bacterium HKST-UBA02]|nr:hypothetical protein [Cyanobacteria bacterium HKST-UBA02]
MNRKALLCLLPALSLLFLSGCASLTSPARKHTLEPGGSYLVDYDATRRGAYILQKDSGARVCAEPAPDVALESISRIIAELRLAQQNADGKAQIELSTKVVELAGRSQLVLILRESLYRLCEQDTIVLLAKSELASEQKAIVEGLQDPEIRRVFERVLEQTQ